MPVEDFLPTVPGAASPQQYATAQQLASIYDYAKALQQQGQQPVRHWSQGVEHIVDALMGGSMAHKADTEGQRTLKAQTDSGIELLRQATPQQPPTISPPTSAAAPVPARSLPPVSPRMNFAGEPAPPEDKGAYNWKNSRNWSGDTDETDLNTGQKIPGVSLGDRFTIGGGAPQGSPTVPTTSIQRPQGPQAPPGNGAIPFSPEANDMVSALANPTGGQPGGPRTSALPDSNAAMLAALRQYMLAGGSLENGLKMIQLRQQMNPVKQDAEGNWYDMSPTLRGQAPIMIKPGHGKIEEYEPYKGVRLREIISIDPVTGQYVRKALPPLQDDTPAGRGTPASDFHNDLPPMPGSPGGPPPTVQNITEWGIKKDAYEAGTKKEAETNASKRAEIYTTKFDKLMKMADTARDEAPQLQLLSQILRNPKMYSGFMSGQVEVLDQIGKMLGITKGQTAALQQFANKLGSAGSLENIQELAQQVSGAIRIPEMQLIAKSNYDPNMTNEAAKAVVDMRSRLANRMLEVAKLANDYADTHGGGIDRNFDRLIQNKYAKTPLISDDEIDQYRQQGIGSDEGITAPAAAGVPEKVWTPTGVKPYVPPQLKKK